MMPHVLAFGRLAHSEWLGLGTVHQPGCACDCKEVVLGHTVNSDSAAADDVVVSWTVLYTVGR